MPTNRQNANKRSGVRLQKILADAGLCSRRKAETLIEDGEVRVNGRIAVLGQKANPENDTIIVRGKNLSTRNDSVFENRATFLLNKPKGFICSHSDPHHQETIYDILPRRLRKLRLFTAGRLDKNSEGLIVLTNDGDLANRLAHPSGAVRKVYHVNLGHPIEETILPKLVQGRELDGEFLHFDRVIPISQKGNALKRLEIHLRHGRKREIRRLLESFGHKVERLRRIQIGGLRIRGMPVGAIKELNEKEINLLFDHSEKPSTNYS